MTTNNHNPQTLTRMDNLASTYGDQGRWNEAEELDMQMMEVRKRRLTQKHPDRQKAWPTWPWHLRIKARLAMLSACLDVSVLAASFSPPSFACPAPPPRSTAL